MLTSADHRFSSTNVAQDPTTYFESAAAHNESTTGEKI